MIYKFGLCSVRKDKLYNVLNIINTYHERIKYVSIKSLYIYLLEKDLRYFLAIYLPKIVLLTSSATDEKVTYYRQFSMCRNIELIQILYESTMYEKWVEVEARDAKLQIAKKNCVFERVVIQF